MFIENEISFEAISDLFSNAYNEGRDYLFEYEVYNLLANSGAETPPAANLLQRGARFSDEELTSLPGDKAVLKIVSPNIIHKTEVGGVRIVKKEPSKIRSAVRGMMYEVPENYASYIEKNPDHAPKDYKGLHGEALIKAISRDLKGVLQVQFMPPDSDSFGNELIVGLRRTREFGTIISAGLGGTDTELYAERFRKGQAIVAASVQMVDGQSFFQLFKNTISYKKLAGLTRGQRRIVTDEQLIECFDSFIEMGKYFSHSNPETKFIIEELEINPFAFTEYLMVPLDGLCRFSRPEQRVQARPVQKIHNLLHPQKIGIIGVSSTRRNFGRIILDNVLAEGYAKEDVVVIRDGCTDVEGVRCVKNLDELDHQLDLFVVAIAAQHIPDLVDKVIELDCAKSVMLIPGGIGETEDSKERAEQIIASINESHTKNDGGPVFIGANCMGVVSRPGGYDTWFIPDEKLPKDRSAPYQRAALISQSGAFMVFRSSQCPELNPAYMLSMGNQTDLTLGDMVHYFKDSKEVDVIAIYAEGFNDLDGLEFCRAVRQAVMNGKEVVFYKAGRTPEGKTATSGHTASLAGNYMVCESCVKQAGAIVARTFQEFQDLFMLAEKLNGKTICGDRLAAVSGAGFEAVGMADSIQSDDYDIGLAEFSEHSIAAIDEILETKKLKSLVTIQNPLDLTPGSNDMIHTSMAEILVKDPAVDSIVIGLDPLSPSMHTLAEPTIPAFSMEDKNSIGKRLIQIVKNSKKPVLAVVDGGRLYDPLRDMLLANKVPVFPVCDRAVAAIALYSKARMHAEVIRLAHGCD